MVKLWARVEIDSDPNLPLEIDPESNSEPPFFIDLTRVGVYIKCSRDAIESYQLVYEPSFAHRKNLSIDYSLTTYIFNSWVFQALSQ
jgi:hypothetical protein